MTSRFSSVKTETPGYEAGRLNCLQHPAGKYPEGRTLRQQRAGGGWYMRR